MTVTVISFCTNCVSVLHMFLSACACMQQFLCCHSFVYVQLCCLSMSQSLSVLWYFPMSVSCILCSCNCTALFLVLHSSFWYSESLIYWSWLLLFKKVNKLLISFHSVRGKIHVKHTLRLQERLLWGCESPFLQAGGWVLVTRDLCLLSVCTASTRHGHAVTVTGYLF